MRLLAFICLDYALTSAISQSFFPLSVGFRARRDTVYRCFLEYTRDTKPLASHLPLSNLTAVLARMDIFVKDAMSRAECYTLEHVLKHHRSGVRLVRADVKGKWHSWHSSLYNQLMESVNLTDLIASAVPGFGDILPSSVPHNVNMKTATLFGLQSS